MSDEYDDIIDLPHHVSSIRPQMSMLERAAQFSPFAALTGYGAAIKETERLTGERIELDEDAQVLLDMKQAYLIELMPERPALNLTYFQADEKKKGGKYVTVSGNFKGIDEYERCIVLTDGKKIPIDDVLNIESEIFREMF